MKRFFKWLILVPLIIVALVFAVINRHAVTVVFDPFGNDIQGLSLTMPLFLALFIAMMIGVLLGSFVTWMSQSRWRRAAREARADLQNLRAQSDRLRLAPADIHHS